MPPDPIAWSTRNPPRSCPAGAGRRPRPCRGSGIRAGSRKPSSGASSASTSASTSRRSAASSPQRPVEECGAIGGSRSAIARKIASAARQASWRWSGGRSPIGPSTRYSQARANVHSFFTVAGDTSSAPAVSSMLRPAKYRSDTIFALRGSVCSRRVSASSTATRSIERRIDAHDPAVELDTLRGAAMSDALIVARALDEDAPHRQRGGGEEMPASIPFPSSRSPATRDTLRARAPSAAGSGAAAARGPAGPSRACAVRHRLPAAARRSARAVVWGRRRHRSANYDTRSIARSRPATRVSAAQPRAARVTFLPGAVHHGAALRPLFPVDLTSLQGTSRRRWRWSSGISTRWRACANAADLGVQHVHWGARPEDYFVGTRGAHRAVRSLASSWNGALESIGARRSRRSSCRCWKARPWTPLSGPSPGRRDAEIEWMALPCPARKQTRDDPPSDRSTASAYRRVDGRQQVAVASHLAHEGRSAGLEGSLPDVRIVHRGEHDDLHLRMRLS